MGGQDNGKQWHEDATDERLRGWGAVLRGRHNADGRGGAAAAIPSATPAATCAAPAENYNFHSNAAADKHRYAFPKLVVLGILAGEQSAMWVAVAGGGARRAQELEGLCHCTVFPPAPPVPHVPPFSLVPPPAGAYIGLGYSLCTLVGGQLSKDLRASEPGLFNLIFGIYGGGTGRMGACMPAHPHVSLAGSLLYGGLHTQGL